MLPRIARKVADYIPLVILVALTGAYLFVNTLFWSGAL